MRLIKIINGTYGYRSKGSRHVEPKKAGDKPFEVSDAEAIRLVSIGVAAFVDASTQTEPKVPNLPVATVAEDDDGSGDGEPPPVLSVEEPIS